MPTTIFYVHIYNKYSEQHILFSIAPAVRNPRQSPHRCGDRITCNIVFDGAALLIDITTVHLHIIIIIKPTPLQSLYFWRTNDININSKWLTINQRIYFLFQWNIRNYDYIYDIPILYCEINVLLKIKIIIIIIGDTAEPRRCNFTIIEPHTSSQCRSSNLRQV